MRAVSSADDCRLCLLRHPETMPLVEACTQGGVALPLDPPCQDESPLQRTLMDHQVVCLRDLSEAPCPDVRPLSDESARSVMLVPLHADALSLGLLAFSASRADAFSPQDADRLQGVAAQGTAALLHWARLLRAEAESEYADAIMEGLTDGLVVLDGDGHIIRANGQLAVLAGYAPGEVALPCSVDDPSCPAALRALLRPSDGTVIGPYEIALELPSRSWRTLRVYPSPLPHPGLGEMRVVRDVTAEREAAEAQALFVSQVAHELRGPLQHIVGFTSLIRDFDDLPRESHERFFGQIKDETDHLARLVDDLVELSRIELGRFRMRPELVRLDLLVAGVVERMHPRSTLRGLSLTLQSAPEPLWTRIDPLRITQVISNLVENAFKFVPSGGSIVVTVQAEGDRHAIVSIADTGPGITPEAMGKLFQRFYQIGTESIRSTPGMGLGLYTCREIIRAHGGEIWAESVYGSGSTFYFRLGRVIP